MQCLMLLLIQSFTQLLQRLLMVKERERIHPQNKQSITKPSTSSHKPSRTSKTASIAESKPWM